MVRLNHIENLLDNRKYSFTNRKDFTPIPLGYQLNFDLNNIFKTNHIFKIKEKEGHKNIYLLANQSPSRILSKLSMDYSNSFDFGEKVYLFTDQNKRVDSLTGILGDFADKIIKDSYKDAGIILNDNPLRTQLISFSKETGSRFYTFLDNEDVIMGTAEQKIDLLLNAYSNFDKFISYLEEKIDIIYEGSKIVKEDKKDKLRND
jgi:hypothetical protein